MSYRKIWEKENGPIPPGYEIHHIDGNRKNNKIENLVCLSLEDHYHVHFEQGDFLACSLMSDRMKFSSEERKIIHKMAMLSRDQTGSKNPMYGRSAILENNLKWYNNGSVEKMFEEDQQPEGFVRGRLFVPSYDKTGKNNPRAKKAVVDGKLYECLKDAHKDYPQIPYSTLKNMARTGKISNKYNLDVKYV